jgi:hypothetical protein
MDSFDSEKKIHVQEDSNGVSPKLIYSFKNLIKKGPVYKIKFRSGAFAKDEMGGEFSDIEENPEDFGADIVRQVLDEFFETLSLESEIEHQESISYIDASQDVKEEEMVNDLEANEFDQDSAKAAMKITQPPARSSARLAAKQISVEKIQKKIISKPEKKKEEDIVMECFSWIFSDDDVNMEEENEDVKKKEDLPGVRRSSRLAEKMTGQKMGEKRLREEQEEVQMKKMIRKPWNYGASGGRRTL